MRLYDVLERNAKTTLENVEITGITDDSRKVQPGSLFVCIQGDHFDGHTVAAKMLEQGAVAVVVQRDLGLGERQILVEDTRICYGNLCAAWFGHPERKMQFIGVTGTNGKTTITNLIKQILTANGYLVGLVGTIQNEIGDQVLHTDNTTPFVYDLMQLLSQMAQAGCDYVVMEVSSFGLVQHRIGPIHFHAAVFTNLTQDHLDYHKTMEDYCNAKAKLFTACAGAACNADDPWRQRILAGSRCPVLLYGLGEEADLRGEDTRLFSREVKFTVRENGKRIPVQVGVPGRFSVYNTLGAMAACRLLGISAETCAQALRTFPRVKGRMEVVPTPGKPYTLLIDYAHTPDALENVLQTARGFARGRVIAVFGCGGDREKEKRPRMGQAVARLADFAVVTSDNPRTEDPEAIIRDILPGMAGAAGRYAVEPDRRKAIALAMEQGRAGDVILLCGKGHETYQEIGNEILPMDEREIVRSLL